MDDGEGWLKLSVASEDTLGVKKTYDVQHYGGIGRSSLSLYQRSCPFKDMHFHFLPAFVGQLGYKVLQWKANACLCS